MIGPHLSESWKNEVEPKSAGQDAASLTPEGNFMSPAQDTCLLIVRGAKRPSCFSFCWTMFKLKAWTNLHKKSQASGVGKKSGLLAWLGRDQNISVATMVSFGCTLAQV